MGQGDKPQSKSKKLSTDIKKPLESKLDGKNKIKEEKRNDEQGIRGANEATAEKMKFDELANLLPEKVWIE